MEIFITRAKYEAETIPVIADYSLLLPSGVTIVGTPTVSVDLFWGTDNNPTNILYGSVTLPNSTSVQQNIRLGVPGNIYNITFSVIGTDSNAYNIVTHLAILPDSQNAVPNYFPYWFSSGIYPIENGPESIQGYTVPFGGRFVQSAYFIPHEDIQGFSILAAGTLTLVVVPYSIPHEDIQGSSILFSGFLVYQNTVSYSIPSDGIKGATVLISGTFTGNVIEYHIPYESIQGSTVLISGTLA